MARVLLDRGLDRGDRVGLLTRNCIEFVEVELAAAKIGVISVNLNWRQTPAEFLELHFNHNFDIPSAANESGGVVFLISIDAE